MIDIQFIQQFTELGQALFPDRDKFTTVVGDDLVWGAGFLDGLWIASAVHSVVFSGPSTAAKA